MDGSNGRWKASNFATRILALEACAVPDESRSAYARLDWASLPHGLQKLLLPHLSQLGDPLNPLEWDWEKASGGCGAPARSAFIKPDAARFAGKVSRGEDEP